MNIEEEIVEIVLWYKSLGVGYNAISELINKRKKLTALRVTLAGEIGLARGKWRNAKVIYEIEKNQKRVIFYKQLKSTTKADWTSRANTEQELLEVTKLENIYYSMNYILETTKEVLSAMNQEIAILRAEKKQSDFFKD